MFARSDSRLFAASHAARAQVFFAKHGPKAVVLARFVPVVRTFTPVVAGVAVMPRRTFTAYNAIGALAWTVGLLAVGYFLGGVPIIAAHVDLFAIGMVAASLVPAAVGLVRHGFSPAAIDPCDTPVELTVRVSWTSARRRQWDAGSVDEGTEVMLIGVCEDDPAIRRLVSRALRSAGHEVRSVYDGGEALRRLGSDSGIEVLVMDVGLPDSDGRDVVQALRSSGQSVPVLFLTALGSVHDRIAGFHAGGDDYVSKPFDVKELLLRVKALGRRGRAAPPTTSGLTLDPAGHEMRCLGGAAALTPTEYRMLAAITSRPGEVVRRKAVVAAAWPDGSIVSENTIDSFIRRIRVKLASIDAPVTIETVRGIGFKLS